MRPWLTPCGQVVDWIRRAYEVDMIFRVGDPPVRVRWFRADLGAKIFQGPNAFQSTGWNGRDQDAGDLGEQPKTFAWKRWDNVFGLTGLHDNCIDPAWFETGLPTGEQTGPWNPATNHLDCCDTGVGPRVGVDCGGGNFICPAEGGVPSVLTAIFSGFSNCTGFNGVPMTMVETSPGTWNGSITDGTNVLDYTLQFCIGGTHGDFFSVSSFGQVTCPATSSNLTGGAFGTCTCTPFVFTRTGMQLDIFSACCFDNAFIDVTITG